ncbi:hypothetical protein BDP55DRAFT_721478 [Colletotrichum godetiae]|uniref:Uncharacterized protein n=1 Tax=Colletotrichum godetiae TaxID=1209918 RepID=A0AAJ0A996_9PEZI|nr:uncharacterized protein BDP55DRAFT_721478 [Colletotrichum godetiae]KAK1657352.1 hypothetical protein BDP55DRAFT_721478 [Colletotrichum godetiae]
MGAYPARWGKVGSKQPLRPPHAREEGNDSEIALGLLVFYRYAQRRMNTSVASAPDSSREKEPSMNCSHKIQSSPGLPNAVLSFLTRYITVKTTGQLSNVCRLHDTFPGYRGARVKEEKDEGPVNVPNRLDAKIGAAKALQQMSAGHGYRDLSLSCRRGRLVSLDEYACDKLRR